MDKDIELACLSTSLLMIIRVYKGFKMIKRRHITAFCELREKKLIFAVVRPKSGLTSPGGTQRTVIDVPV